MPATVTVSLLIDLPPDHAYHRASVAALRHAANHLALPTEIRVVPTDTIGSARELVARPGSAMFVGPGTPYRDPDAVHACIAAARESGAALVAT